MSREKLTEAHIALLIKIAHGQRDGQYGFPEEPEIIKLLDDEYVNSSWWPALRAKWFLTEKGKQALAEWQDGQREETETTG